MVENWMKAPALLQNIMLVIAINHQLIRRNVRPYSSIELLEYRGEALIQLRTELLAPSKASSSIALVAVLLVLAAEIQFSALSQWEVHLEAAKGMIAQLGGLTKCWNTFPLIRQLLALYLQIHIMSMTTTPIHLLTQMDPDCFNLQLEDLEELDTYVLSTCAPFPPFILGMVSSLNFTRYALASGITSAQDSFFDVTEAIDLLQEFSVFEWAHHIVETQLPAMGAWDCRLSIYLLICVWRQLGACYQSAAVIYAIRSLQPLVSPSDVIRNPGFGELLLPLYGLIETQRRLLQTNLEQIFSGLDVEKKSANTMNLWKFVLWPLYVDSYEILGWDSQQHEAAPSPPDSDLVVPNLSRLRWLGAKLGSRSFFDAASQLQIVVERRQQQPMSIWRWDDGFDGRCIFVV